MGTMTHDDAGGSFVNHHQAHAPRRPSRGAGKAAGSCARARRNRHLLEPVFRTDRSNRRSRGCCPFQTCTRSGNVDNAVGGGNNSLHSGRGFEDAALFALIPLAGGLSDVALPLDPILLQAVVERFDAHSKRCCRPLFVMVEMRQGRKDRLPFNFSQRGA